MPSSAEEPPEKGAGWIAHLTWTQIGTALNTLGVFVAIALGAVALGIAVNAGDNTKIVTQATPAAAAATVPPNPNAPILASLGDGPGGPPNAGAMWIGLSRSTTVGKGKVTFNVKNVGRLVHEFVVIRTDKPANGLGTGPRVPENGNVGETGDVQAGASKTLSLKLKPGHYALICNIPNHYSSGMHTDFTVR